MSAQSRRRLGLVITVGIWTLGYTIGRLAGLVQGLREGHALNPPEG